MWEKGLLSNLTVNFMQRKVMVLQSWYWMGLLGLYSTQVGEFHNILLRGTRLLGKNSRNLWWLLWFVSLQRSPRHNRVQYTSRCLLLRSWRPKERKKRSIAQKVPASHSCDHATWHTSNEAHCTNTRGVIHGWSSKTPSKNVHPKIRLTCMALSSDLISETCWNINETTVIAMVD